MDGDLGHNTNVLFPNFRAANISPPYLTFPQQTPCLKRSDVLVPVITLPQLALLQREVELALSLCLLPSYAFSIGIWGAPPRRTGLLGGPAGPARCSGQREQVADRNFCPLQGISPILSSSWAKSVSLIFLGKPLLVKFSQLVGVRLKVHT